MATKSAAPKAKATAATPAPAKATAAPKAPATRKPLAWDDLLDTLKSGSGNFIYPKDGRTRLRLLPSEPQYVEATSIYQGNERTKYLIPCYDPEVDEPVVKVVVFTKAAFRSLVTMITEGYEFFEEEEGFGITIVRSGTGGDTSWMILPSKKAMPVDERVMELLEEFDLAEVATAYEENQKRRAAEGGKGGKAGGKPRRRMEEVEEDEDDEDEEEEEKPAPRRRR